MNITPTIFSKEIEDVREAGAFVFRAEWPVINRMVHGRRVRRRSDGGPPVKATVLVRPKHGILDPQGKAVQNSLHALGFAEVQDVKVGKYIELRLREAEPQAASARVREMCERLLANGVIEDFQFQLERDGR